MPVPPRNYVPHYCGNRGGVTTECMALRTVLPPGKEKSCGMNDFREQERR